MNAWRPPRGAATKLGTARRIIARCATPRNATTRYACLHDGAPQAHASKAPEEALKRDCSAFAADSPGEGALEPRALAEAANYRFQVEPWQAKNKKAPWPKTWHTALHLLPRKAAHAHLQRRDYRETPKAS